MKMLTNALSALVKNPFKENFWGKVKKAIIIFFFNIKVVSKIS